MDIRFVFEGICTPVESFAILKILSMARKRVLASQSSYEWYKFDPQFISRRSNLINQLDNEFFLNMLNVLIKGVDIDYVQFGFRTENFTRGY